MSDTIIMYENGKAVGGEGHPTNADEITFDNTGTDLVSEEVESAIKEVNAKFDRGSVSVTGDGSKTYAQLLNELYALVDLSKISKSSVLQIQSSGGFNNAVLNTGTSSSLTFTWSYARQNGGSEVRQYLVSSTSGYYQTQGSTYSDNSSIVVASGTKLAIEY